MALVNNEWRRVGFLTWTGADVRSRVGEALAGRGEDAVNMRGATEAPTSLLS